MESVANPEIPYVGRIVDKCGPGKWIKIYGTVPIAAFRFTITLQCDANTPPRDDVALQISVNILDNNVSLNSMQKGVWDEAKTILGVPIKCANSFEVALTCDAAQYQVSINGEGYCLFPQRIKYSAVTHLAIDGDVSVQQIVYKLEATPLPPGFKQAEAEALPPAYSEVQSKLYQPHSANYGACPLPYATREAPAYQSGRFVAAIPGQYSTYAQAVPYASQSGTLSPLNAASSNFRPVLPSRRKKYISCACIVFILVVVIGLGLINRGVRRHHYHHNHYERDRDWDY